MRGWEFSGHNVEKWKMYCHSKKISSNQLFSIYFIHLVKTLLSRNFCQKSVTVNFHNFHTVVEKPHCNAKITEILSHLFGKNFVKSTLLRNKHSVEKYTKTLSRWKIFRQIAQQKFAKYAFTNAWFSCLRANFWVVSTKSNL